MYELELDDNPRISFDSSSLTRMVYDMISEFEDVGITVKFTNNLWEYLSINHQISNKVLEIHQVISNVFDNVFEYLILSEEENDQYLKYILRSEDYSKDFEDKLDKISKIDDRDIVIMSDFKGVNNGR